MSAEKGAQKKWTDELKLKLLATAIVNKLPGTVKLSELMRSETGSDWPSHRAVEHVMVDLKKIGIKDQNADSTDVKRKPGGDTPRKKQKLEGNGGIKKSSPKMKRKRSAHEKDESITTSSSDKENDREEGREERE